MGRALITDRGIVLKTIKHGESDLIVRLINVKGAKISLFGRGALNSKKRFGGGVLEPTHLIRVNYKESNREDGLGVLQEASLIQDFKGIRKDYDRLQMAFQFLKQVDRYSQEGLEDNEEVFSILGNSLKSLETSEHLENLRLFFEAKILHSQGVLTHFAFLDGVLGNKIEDHGSLILSAAQKNQISKTLKYFEIQ